MRIFFAIFLCNLKASKVKKFLQIVCTFSPLNILNIEVIETKKLQEEIRYKNFFFTAFNLRKIKAEKKITKIINLSKMCSKLHNKQKHFQSFLFSIAASRSNGENESYQLLLLIKICYTMRPEFM